MFGCINVFAKFNIFKELTSLLFLSSPWSEFFTCPVLLVLGEH